MNIVLYGVPAEVVRRIVETFRLRKVESPAEFGEENALLSVKRARTTRELLSLFNTLTEHEQHINVVIVCGCLECETANMVRYSTAKGKYHSIAGGPDLEAQEYEIERIIQSHLGLICAHEGV